MATFSKSSFSVAAYASFRPTYSPSLYKLLTEYHKGTHELAIDIGCGPGTATKPLSTHFDRVIGTDPSQNMIENATRSTLESNITYAVCSAEDLSSLQVDPRCRVFPGDVDFIGVGQAVHWFNHDEWFHEMYRMIRPGGTLAYWGYSDAGFKGYPKATEILRRYAYHDDYRLGLGRYWPKGREIVRDLNRSVVPPESQWTDVRRIEYQSMGKSNGERIVWKKSSVADLIMYMTSWSSWQEWKDAHPKSRSRLVEAVKDKVDVDTIEPLQENEVPDVLDGCVEEIMKTEGWNVGTEVEIEWDSSIVMARRKE